MEINYLQWFNPLQPKRIAVEHFGQKPPYFVSFMSLQHWEQYKDTVRDKIQLPSQLNNVNHIFQIRAL